MSRGNRIKRRSDYSWIPRLLNSFGKGVLSLAGVLCAIGLLSAFFLSLYQFALLSPLLRLEIVQVEGADPVLERELMAMGKLHSGLSLAGIQLGKLKRDMEAHPWVRRVQIERRLPHTLIISVEKEEPVAIVVLDHARFLNKHGELFKRVTAVDPVNFPVITGLPADSPELPSLLARAVDILNTLGAEQPPWAVDNLAEIHLRDRSDLSLYYTHMNARIECTPDALAEAMPNLRQLTSYLQEKGELERLRSINLNYTEGAVAAFAKS